MYDYIKPTACESDQNDICMTVFCHSEHDYIFTVKLLSRFVLGRRPRNSGLQWSRAASAWRGRRPCHGRVRTPHQACRSLCLHQPHTTIVTVTYWRTYLCEWPTSHVPAYTARGNCSRSAVALCNLWAQSDCDAATIQYHPLIYNVTTSNKLGLHRNMAGQPVISFDMLYWLGTSGAAGSEILYPRGPTGTITTTL